MNEYGDSVHNPLEGRGDLTGDFSCITSPEILFNLPFLKFAGLILTLEGIKKLVLQQGK